MTNLEYTEIDGLLYPILETGMKGLEIDSSKYGIQWLRFLHEHKCK